MNYKNRKFAGFTIIELLVVIVIIGILATISVSTFNGYFKKARLAKAQQFASTAESKLKADTISRGLKMTFHTPFNNIDTSHKTIDIANNLLVWIDGVTSNDTPWNTGKSTTAENVNWSFGLWTNGNFALNSNQITLSGWIKYNDENYQHYLLRAMYGVAQIKLSNNHYPLFVVMDKDDNSIQALVRGKKKVVKDEWNHLLGTFDGSEARLYLNGELLGKTTNNNVVLKNSISSIQSWVGPVTNIDDLQIYPVALTGIDPRTSIDIQSLPNPSDFDLS